jgi:CheY-like chemotaxis protein
MRIYVAHPSAEAAEALAHCLREREPAEVKVFDCGLQLYAALIRSSDDVSLRPSVVVVDAAMPRVGGLLLARLIKFHDLLGRIRILLTARRPVAVAEEAASVRADELVEFSGSQVEAVARRVHQLLARADESGERGNGRAQRAGDGPPD